MATTKAALSHLERTAEEPRDNSLHTARLSKITQVNPTIRLFQLTPTSPPIKFSPGQWLDVYCPSIPKAGGFTITSSPSTPYLELAIQKSPSNPPAAWLWQPPEKILGEELRIRVGGSFTWGNREGIKRVVFIAGGVGINPLISMVSSIAEEKRKGIEVKFLYSSSLKGIERVEDEVLFLNRLTEIFESLGKEGDFKLFLTGVPKTENEKIEVNGKIITAQRRRITEHDLLDALGSVEDRRKTVCYICGVPSMTDEFVEKARKTEGMLEGNVLFEKWW